MPSSSSSSRVLLVTVPLGVTGQRIAEEARTEGVSKAIAVQWVANTEYEVQGLTVTQDDLTLVIVGHGTQPPFTNLVTQLRTALQRPVKVILKVVPADKVVSQ